MKSNNKIVQKFLSSKLSSLGALQTNYDKSGKILSYSVGKFYNNSITGKAGIIPIEGLENLTKKELLNKINS